MARRSAKVLQNAITRASKVIAYDRLIKGTKNVDYYATFDNFQVGVLQASSIVDKLGAQARQGPFNIELFGGSPDDNNAYFFYDGAISVLKPYMDSGKLVVRSKQLGMNKVGTLRWDSATARPAWTTCSQPSTAPRGPPVLSPYDGISIGIPVLAQGVGYCTAKSSRARPMSGQDAGSRR